MSIVTKTSPTIHLLTRLMRAEGLNQSELARRVGVSRQCVSLWFRRGSRPSQDVVERIAKLINVESWMLWPVPRVEGASAERW